MHLSEPLIIFLALQNVIKIPKYMVHKIAFCIEQKRYIKNQKSNEKALKVEVIGRWVDDHYVRKKNHISTSDTHLKEAFLIVITIMKMPNLQKIY